jgi:hypothetical protein
MNTAAPHVIFGTGAIGLATPLPARIPAALRSVGFPS